jgi:hypothetical protein
LERALMAMNQLTDANYIPPAFGMGANVGPKIPGTTQPAFVSAFGGSSAGKINADINPAKRPLGALPVQNFPRFGHGSPLPNPQPIQPPGSSKGYASSWQWHTPPGVGDAPQHVWTTYYLAPVDNVRGPGDLPISFLNTANMRPMIQNFSMRWQGMPVQGGNILLTGLYTPQPISPW